MTPDAKPKTPLTDALYQPTHASFARVKLETGYQHACKLEKESALLTERLSLSQQDRHTLEVECRELRVQNDKLRRALQNLLARVDINGGLGEYKGGPAFAVKDARACLAAISQTEG